MKRALALAGAIAIAGVLLWLGHNRTSAVPEAAAQAVAPAAAEAPQAPAPTPVEKAERAEEPNPVAPPPVVTATPSPGQEAFRQLAKETWETIPLKSKLQARSSSELHTTPSELVNTGEQIGRIQEALEADPALVPLGLRFFANCTRNDDFPTSVRALCLDRLRRFGAEQGLKEEDLVGTEIPPQVKGLADQLGDSAN